MLVSGSCSGHFSGGDRSATSEFGVSLNWEHTDGYAPRIDSDIKRGYDNLSVNIYGARQIGSNEVSIRHWQGEGQRMTEARNRPVTCQD